MSLETPEVGASFSFRKTLSVAEQAMFTGISGNLAPLYVDATRARAQGAANMLVFELAAAALASTCLNRLGGAGRRVQGLNLQFPSALVVGETLEARATVERVDGERLVCRVEGTEVGSSRVVFQGDAELVPFAG